MQNKTPDKRLGDSIRGSSLNIDRRTSVKMHHAIDSLKKSIQADHGAPLNMNTVLK